MKLSKEQTIKVLQSIIYAIENNDSFEGSFNYRIEDIDTFEVQAAYRVGNSEGQGGMVLIDEDDNEDEE